jgi:O-antigen/teichoic acid export membrane protein
MRSERRLALNGVAAVGAKLVSLGSALLTVPLALHYLGLERYGLWMTVVSLVGMLSFADFGIGNGVLSAVAACDGRGDRAGIARFAASGTWTLAAVAAALLAAFAVAYAAVPWAELFNVRSAQARAEAGPAVAALVVCTLLAGPAAIAQRVQTGMQRGWLASLSQAAGSLLALACVYAAIRAGAALPWLVLSLAGPPVLAAVVNALLFFGGRGRDLAPALRRVDAVTAREVASTGLLFLGLQLVAALAYASDNLVIARVLGAAAVPDYAVPERMFSVVGLLWQLLLSPLWPAYAAALARGDAAWVRSTLARTILASMAFAAAFSAVLFAFGDRLLALWVGHAVHVDPGVLLALGTWKVLEAGGAALAVYLNGARVLRVQLAFSVVMALAALPLKFLLVERLGAAGAAWATVLAYGTFVAAPWMVVLPRYLPRLPAGAIAR